MKKAVAKNEPMMKFGLLDHLLIYLEGYCYDMSITMVKMG